MLVKLLLCRNLTIREKVELLHKLCHWRLELDDIGDLLKVSVMCDFVFYVFSIVDWCPCTIN